MLWLYWEVKGQPGNTETAFKACRSNHSVSGFFLPAAYTGCASIFLYIYLFPNSTSSGHSKPHFFGLIMDSAARTSRNTFEA